MNFIIKKRAYVYVAFIGLFLNLSACANEEKQKIRALTSLNELEKVFTRSGEKLIGFDLYADWCLPCKILSPMLEEIAEEHRDEVTFYKINVDKNPDLAYAFGVSGIPYVVFVKNGKPVKAAAGLRSKEAYVRIIKQYALSETAIHLIHPESNIS